MDVKENNNILNGFEIIKLSNQYFPQQILPTDITYDYGIISYCQQVLSVINYMVVNNSKTEKEIETDLVIIENNMYQLLSKVDTKLVQRYLPELLNNNSIE